MLSLYIHWPFCKSKCPYCDFNSHVRDQVDSTRWQQAYLTELKHFLPHIQGRTVKSVFFGGGTPSLMPPSVVEAILSTLAGICNLPADTEITLEANPTSVEAEKFRAFNAAGINRVSLGIQSLNDKDLAFLGREHNSSEALHAIALARENFSRYSFDLIYARPGQSLAAWEAELQQALSLAGKHLSLYQLTIEKGTPFYSAYRKAAFELPDENLSAGLYTLTETLMNEAGMPAYEISNYATPGEECRHNLVYWQYGEYLGIGPGAHSRLVMDSKRHALMTTHSPENWLHQVETQGHGMQSMECLSPREMVEECLLMGLRLVDGIQHADFEHITGKTIANTLPQPTIQQIVDQGFLMIDQDKIAATYQGRLVLNALVARLLEI